MHTSRSFTSSLVFVLLGVGCSVEAAPPPVVVTPPPVVPEVAKRVELGIDVLLAPGSEYAALLVGKRVGLITNPSGVDGALVATADRLAHDTRFQLQKLFGPEHGIRGDAAAGDSVGDALDPVTGIPVESLYGARKSPSPEALAELDVIVFDIQDIGSRTYTYVSTLGEALKGCAAAGKPLVVLDRPNPIGGVVSEGAVIEERFKSFIGWGPIPVTHGMTTGEIARYWNAALAIGCELHVVPLRNWKRSMAWEDTGLTWTQTSPHIPHALQAHLYVATGMVASSLKNVSDGVGSTLPFEIIAAEFIDGPRFARELSAFALPGVRFQALAVKPFYGGYKDKPLRGVRLVLEDPRVFKPLRASLAILITLHKLYGDELLMQSEAVIAKHWGNTQLLEQLRAGATIDEIERSWAATRVEYENLRASVLLY